MHNGHSLAIRSLAKASWEITEMMELLEDHDIEISDEFEKLAKDIEKNMDQMLVMLTFMIVDKDVFSAFFMDDEDDDDD
jgi:hypothetical protein